MVHSRNKGAAGEREWAHFLTERGFAAIRGQQFHGGADSPDVKCEAMSGFHPEVKRVETFNVYKALIQASDDAGEGEIPYVAHRRNNHPWVVCFWADDFIKLVKDARNNEAVFLIRKYMEAADRGLLDPMAVFAEFKAFLAKISQ